MAKICPDGKLKIRLLFLGLLVIAAAWGNAWAGEPKTARSAQTAGTAVRKSGGMETSMSQSTTFHLDRLDKVVAMLHTKTTRKEAVAAFFGVNLPNASSDGSIAIRKYGLAKVRIYDLPHIAIDIAADLFFEDESRPRLAELETRLGNSQFVPRAPDDFSSGARVAFYPRSENSPAFVRMGHLQIS